MDLPKDDVVATTKKPSILKGTRSHFPLSILMVASEEGCRFVPTPPCSIRPCSWGLETTWHQVTLPHHVIIVLVVVIEQGLCLLIKVIV